MCMEFYHWENDDATFRKLILHIDISIEKEIDKFINWQGDFYKCNKCKTLLPKSTYFFISGGKDKFHRYCKTCETGKSYGWGRNYNNELNKHNLHYCSTCDRVLPLNNLYFNKTNGRFNKTGYVSNCKECKGHSFGHSHINNTIDDIKPGFKICHICMLELPNNDIYFFKKNGRENGQTTCKQCKGYNYGIERINKVLANELDEFHRFCSICKERKHIDEMSDKSNCKTCKKVISKKYNSTPKAKERLRRGIQKRRSIKNELLATLTRNEFLETLEFFGHKCAYCGMPELDHKKEFGEHLHYEHVIPLSKGGHFIKENIIPSCRSCNCSKSNRDLDEYYEYSDKFTEQMYNKIIEYINSFKEVCE